MASTTDLSPRAGVLSLPAAARVSSDAGATAGGFGDPSRLSGLFHVSSRILGLGDDLSSLLPSLDLASRPPVERHLAVLRATGQGLRDLSAPDGEPAALYLATLVCRAESLGVLLLDALEAFPNPPTSAALAAAAEGVATATLRLRRAAVDAAKETP